MLRVLCVWCVFCVLCGVLSCVAGLTLRCLPPFGAPPFVAPTFQGIGVAAVGACTFRGSDPSAPCGTAPETSWRHVWANCCRCFRQCRSLDPKIGDKFPQDTVVPPCKLHRVFSAPPRRHFPFHAFFCLEHCCLTREYTTPTRKYAHSGKIALVGKTPQLEKRIRLIIKRSGSKVGKTTLEDRKMGRPKNKNHGYAICCASCDAARKSNGTTHGLHVTPATLTHPGGNFRRWSTNQAWNRKAGDCTLTQVFCIVSAFRTLHTAHHFLFHACWSATGENSLWDASSNVAAIIASPWAVPLLFLAVSHGAEQEVARPWLMFFHILRTLHATPRQQQLSHCVCPAPLCWSHP